jgi:hypothetical protein
LSISTIISFDTNIGNLLSFGPSNELAQHLAKGYCECMQARFRVDRAYKDVSIDPVSEADMVWLNGPWKGSGWIGASSLTLGTGVKWGVFLTDQEERIDVLREALCLAEHLKTGTMIFFNSGERAFDVATDGAPLPDIVNALNAEARAVFEVSSPADADALAESIRHLSDSLEEGYFKVLVTPTA